MGDRQAAVAQITERAVSQRRTPREANTRPAVGVGTRDQASRAEAGRPCLGARRQHDVGRGARRVGAQHHRHVRARPVADDPPPVLDSGTRTLLDRYVQAWEREDIAALTQLLHADARLSMPPLSATYRGPAAITAFWASVMDHKRTPDRWRLLPTRANTQPAFAFYQREPGMPAHVAHGILVLRVTGGLIDELTMFLDPDLFPHFKLPAILPS